MKFISIFLTIISVFLVYDEYENYRICAFGQKVNTILIRQPEHCNSKYTYPTFNYNGQIFKHKFSRNFCEDHNIGDIFEFYHNKKYPDKFVLASMKYDGVFLEIFAGVALFFLGIISVYFTFIKK